MKKRKLKKEDLDKMGDLNLDKVLDEISKIDSREGIKTIPKNADRQIKKSEPPFVDFSFKGDIKYHQIGKINTKRRLITMIKQKLLSFKLSRTKEDITARAGLAVYSEFQK